MPFRFSGHESFPLRYAWLPKAYKALVTNPFVFTDEDRAMVELGVGKNMVRSIRFWVQAFGIAKALPNGALEITRLGQALFDFQNGLDPYLEDIRTLWILHWRLSSEQADPLFAWDYLLNRWQHPDISPSEVLLTFEHEAALAERQLSRATLEQHFDIFLHTYVARRKATNETDEDNLDCPLVDLGLIIPAGERRNGSGIRERIYSFRRTMKPEISPALFAYILGSFWDSRHGDEDTLSFRDVSVSHGSPGQLLKLPEQDIRERLESLVHDTSGTFAYQEGLHVQRITRTEFSLDNLLSAVYSSGGFIHA